MARLLLSYCGMTILLFITIAALSWFVTDLIMGGTDE